MKWAFWIAATFLFYTYIGYALWLKVRCQLRPMPVQRGRCEPRVSIVLVVRNEERVLARKVENLLTLDYPAERLEIVAVSDGSTDGTAAILREYASQTRVMVVLNQLTRGKASGLNNAMQLASGEVVVFTDARQQIEAGALRVLLENFADPRVGGVSGELMLGNPQFGEASEGLGLYWRIEKQIRQMEAASGSVVGATGAFYAIRRECWAAIPEETILDDVIIPMQVVRSGARVVFEPEARVWDSLQAGQEFSRKVRTLTGNYQLLRLAPWLLTRDNPIRFELVCHKLMRLAAPFALLTTFVTTMFLTSWVYRAALAVQLLFYGLSLLAAVGLKAGRVARLAEACCAFVMLNLAATIAFANFVTGRKVVWVR